jgi:formate dehydrogenase maturation protein FdhE
MTRFSTSILAMALTASCTVYGQAPDHISGPMKALYNGIKDRLMKAADKMPESDYAFKPVPEIRSFGQLIAHVADSQTRACSSITGESKTGNAASKTSKADLVAALKESFAVCDAAFNAQTDESITQLVKTPRGEVARVTALAGILAHSNEEYGYMAVYLRLKNIVPPSSERR